LKSLLEQASQETQKSESGIPFRFWEGIPKSGQPAINSSKIFHSLPNDLSSFVTEMYKASA
jgi:hypothetical protein